MAQIECANLKLVKYFKDRSMLPTHIYAKICAKNEVIVSILCFKV